MKTNEEEATAERIKQRLGLGEIIGESQALLAVIERLPRIARCDLSVLLRGETGTGKEICARAIHYLSSRGAHPFIALDCGALPADLVENELFGHEPGAYTSATSSAAGVVKQAAGGTLFLDEVDSLAPSVQVKLLRFLQDKRYRPLGSEKVHTADLRFIAATNCDLKAAVQSGRFREDLYYRLAVLEMLLPPLRERGRDIEILADCFLKRYASELNKTLTGFAPEASLVLRFYRWPGNVRELENVVARAVVFAQGSLVQPGDIHLPCRQSQPEPRKCSFKASKTDAIQIFEMNYLTQILQEYKGNISHAAKAAGKDRRAFWQLLRKHGFLPPSRARTIVLNPLPQPGTVRPAPQR